MKGCLSRQPVPGISKSFPKLVDHRYFYQDYKKELGAYVGNYTCGLARNAVATELRVQGVNFADIDFLSSLPDYIHNPSITGFMIEQAVLSSIKSHGLDIGAGINHPMKLVMFEGNFPRFETKVRKQPVLYCPQQFNFRGIDGIIVHIPPQGNPKGKRKRDTEEKKQKLFMFPLQITLSPKRHSDSYKTFFSQYDKWTEDLTKFDVEPQFIWITPNPPSVEHDNRKRYLPLSDVNQDIWDRYLSAKQRQEAPGGSEESEMSEESGGKERLTNNEAGVGKGRGIRGNTQAGPDEQSNAKETKKVEGRKGRRKMGTGTRGGRA